MARVRVRMCAYSSFNQEFSKTASFDENLTFLRNMLTTLHFNLKSVVFVLDGFERFARARGKQQLLYNLFDMLQHSKVQVSDLATHMGSALVCLQRWLFAVSIHSSICHIAQGKLCAPLQRLSPQAQFKPLCLSVSLCVTQAAVLGLTCAQDVMESMEKRVRSRFSHRRIILTGFSHFEVSAIPFPHTSLCVCVCVCVCVCLCAFARFV